MISKLKIDKTATFSEPIEIIPTEINYLYGSNGSGKTSLGKVISDISSYHDCSLDWTSNQLEVLVYNRDFVVSNFNQSNEIKGIFTLGKDATEAQTFIAETKVKVEELKVAIEGIDKSILSKSKVLSEKETETIEKCWSIKLKYDSYFKPAFTGFIGSGKVFFDKCLIEMVNGSDLLDENTIINKCNRVYSDTLMTYEEITSIDLFDISIKEKFDILTSKIIGKEDVAIGELIKKLENSDWVKNGIQYLEISEEKCPFCQQDIFGDLKGKIESFFDEDYNNKIAELIQFRTAYKQYFGDLILKANSISKLNIPILNFTDLTSKAQLFEEQYKNNLNSIDSKLITPSLPVTISSLETIALEIQVLINSLIEEIKANNIVVDNIEAEKTTLKSQIWKYVVNELDLDLKAYNSTKAGIDLGVKTDKDNRKIKFDLQSELEKQVRDKESLVTSVTHTVNEINKILVLFGFTNFKLLEADKKGFYVIIREDGSEVKETLSEGEYTFVTFLYYYHLLKGSNEETGLAKDKIVVIDDPISSLDSNVLFIVSNLIKTIIQDARKGSNGIKQIFILTHNVYFFKEVTFKGRGGKWKEESYWIIRKLDNKTRIIEHKENPIKTTYELLWRELDDLESINKANIFNTLRRILEYYFNILGGLDYEDAISKFEGEEQIIFKSLVSWINDGSHFINDDLVVYVEPETIEKYLKVFESIFIKMGHESHYKMMRRINNITP